MDPFPTMLILSLVSAMLVCINADKIVNVLDYGAVGNGITDDTFAFIKMWNDTCDVERATPTLIIPSRKTFFVQPIIFAGPCKSNYINIVISGLILAEKDPSKWKSDDRSLWLAFEGVNGLSITGHGTIDGRGKGTWDRSCRDHPGQGCLTLAPNVLKFVKCNQVHMSNISIINSPQTHILLLGSYDVDFRSLTIIAPATSPNTDGIHISDSGRVFIQSSSISSGDDCISIGDGTSNINITHIECGPGHGVSIGSLGRDGAEVKVENITVRHVNFTGTTNGVRIKTWQAGRGVARHIIFDNIHFAGVENPLIIDQYYCDVKNACEKMATGVHISDVSYSGLIGTSKTKVAINLNCSQSVPCTEIQLDNIQLSSAVRGQQVISSCNNAHGVSKGTVKPKSCLRG